ncbi:MAG TPA: hypothetical protein DCE44_01880 [Verrucomicrobiales bacterium]|nr:hypothetical protein [Verrucomicrobiales bacterium]
MTAMLDHLELHRCRHGILGHYLKAIGLLRVLARCVDESPFKLTYQTEAGRSEYFAALADADRQNWQPLTPFGNSASAPKSRWPLPTIVPPYAQP